ncbi:MAG TPA: CPBP family intramembrane glutamic endopeptidase [Rhodanobacteraceae bacterium]|nr:CPBP family intramembrane glutamic endopeptidase [Rhodanobacteraceae bacterium]
MQRSTDSAARTAVVFALLALGFAVLYWAAVVLSRSGALPFSMESAGFARASVAGSAIWLVFRDFGPAIAGVIALAICGGRAALAGLARSLVRWRVPGWLYLAAWFGLVLNAGYVVAGYAAGSLAFDPSAFAPVRFVLLFFVMAAIDGPLGEEIGWRGVLLPALLQRFSPLAAALAVGVVWYAWHVPLYAADDKLPGFGDHVLFLYSCLALSVIFTAFFLKSGASTFLMIYLHDATNYAMFLRFKLFAKTAASPLPTAVYAVLLLIVAVIAGFSLARQRTARLEDGLRSGPAPA